MGNGRPLRYKATSGGPCKLPAGHHTWGVHRRPHHWRSFRSLDSFFTATILEGGGDGDVNQILWGLFPRKAQVWAVVKGVKKCKKSFGFFPVSEFHFPPILLSPSLEEDISGFFQHPARFCSVAAAGKDSRCLHSRHNRVPQTGRLEQATPAPQPWRSSCVTRGSIWLQTTLLEFWDHVCRIQQFQPVFASQINFWVIKN